MKMKYPANIRISILLNLTLLSWGVLLPTNAICQLSAEAELNYVNLDVRDNSNQRLSAHSLSQRYSLLYQTEGRLVDGRMGRYNLALGYDWSTFDTTIKSTSGSENPQGSRGHILYRGDILIDPKEMPLRLTAFSRDMNRSIFSEDSSNLLGTQIGNSLTGTPRIVTGIMDGQHIDSGATLVMGVKNGMSNGNNELLRHFPMLMLDYRDLVNRDLNSSAPINDRLSRLAFVSLNKKDNWFHYRLVTYNDYINPLNNYKENQIQLGTVDQTLQRRWVDFTNWLQVSADGQLTRRTNGISTTGLSAANFTEFDLNLFGSARRSDWEARTFNNFNRKKEDDGRITYRTTVPVYANGSVSADTAWSTRFSMKEDHDNRDNRFSDISGGYRVDTFKRSSFTLSQQLELEHASSNSLDLFVISAAAETTSTARFSRAVSLGASYKVRNYSYGGTANSSDFLDQTIRATASYTPTNKTRLSLSQINRFTSGTSQYVSSEVQGATVVTPQYVNPRNNQGLNGSSYQSITALAFAWTPLPRLNIGLFATEDIYAPQDAPRSYQTVITQTTDYYSANLKLSSANSFSFDNVQPTTNSNSLTSRNRADYTFSRNLDSHVSVTYNKAFDNSTETDVLNVEQGLNYYYYRINGVTRKLFEINESADHTKGNSTFTNSPSIAPDAFFTPGTTIITTNRNSNRNTNISLGAKYYPVRQLLLAAGSRYSFFNSFNDYTLTWYGSIALNYRLLQASLDYIYGTAKADGRIERKVTANVRKVF